jgi:hypothetical protein
VRSSSNIATHARSRTAGASSEDSLVSVLSQSRNDPAIGDAHLVGIKETLEQLKQALTARPEVHSAALYGSYVRGRHRPGRSDINLALVMRSDDVSGISPALREAWRVARVDPWIARDTELAGLADVFASRVRDIQRNHEMLVGDDPWTALVVPRAALRLRVEQDLRNHQLRLRHAEALSDGTGIARQLFFVAGSLRLDLALLEELAGSTVSDDELPAAAARRLDISSEDITHVLEHREHPNASVDAAKRVLDRAVSFVEHMEVT